MNRLLLPRGCRIVGWFAVPAGLVLAVIRFHYGIKLPLFNLKVPAIYSDYLEPRYFTLVTNHYSEEVAGALVLVGLICLAFSRQRDDGPWLMQVRLQAMLVATYLNTGFLLVSILFVFGIGFIDVLFLNLFSPLVIYLLVFVELRRRARRTRSGEGLATA